MEQEKDNVCWKKIEEEKRKRKCKEDNRGAKWKAKMEIEVEKLQKFAIEKLKRAVRITTKEEELQKNVVKKKLREIFSVWHCDWEHNATIKERRSKDIGSRKMKVLSKKGRGREEEMLKKLWEENKRKKRWKTYER